MNFKIQLLVLFSLTFSQFGHAQCTNPNPEFSAISFGCNVQFITYYNDNADCEQSWNFGDNSGNNQTDENGMYAYQFDGTYQVTYTVDGLVFVQAVTITGCAPPPSCNNPGFTATAIFGDCCVNVSLTQAIPANCNVSWDFGDNSGTSQPDSDGNYCYNQPGIYNITLTINGTSVTQFIAIAGCNNQQPPCNNFDILEFPIGGDGNQCILRYFLVGEDTEQQCNEWTITITPPGSFPYVLTYTNQNFITLPTLTENTNAFVCVTVCGDGCIPNTRCINRGCYFSLQDDDDSKSLNRPNDDNDHSIHAQVDLREGNSFHEKSIMIAPNPVTDQVNIRHLNKRAKQLRIYDNLGRVQKEINLQGLQTKTVQMYHFENGVYWIQIEMEDGKQETQKIIKID